MPTVVMTDDIHKFYDIEEKLFAEAGVTLKLCDFSTPEEALSTVKDADGILVNLLSLPASLIQQLTQCKVISRYGTGYDNIDAAAAQAAGIWVGYVPAYGTESVTDHSLAMLLACMRQLCVRDAAIRNGKWNIRAAPRPTPQLAGRVFGVAGLGNCGRAIIQKVSGFRFSRILVYDPHKDPQTVQAAGAEQVDLETFVSQCDFISWHMPLTPETQEIINARIIEQAKPQAIWVNTARGGIFDEAALAHALQNDTLAYAGLDVFQQEPLPSDSPLLQLDNVILTDHSAFFSDESIVELKTIATQNILEVFAGRKPLYPANNPSTSLS